MDICNSFELTFRMMPLNLMWVFMNDLELILHIPLLNLKTPSLLLSSIEIIAKFMKIEIIPFEKISSEFISFEDEEYDDSTAIMNILEYST